ncbi:MAG: transposase [Tenacibaculum sp.]
MRCILIQITKWKREFIGNASKAFEGTSEQGQEKEMEKLYTKIGKLEVERDFLKKSLWKTTRTILQNNANN